MQNLNFRLNLTNKIKIKTINYTKHFKQMNKNPCFNLKTNTNVKFMTKTQQMSSKT